MMIGKSFTAKRNKGQENTIETLTSPEHKCGTI